MISRYCLHFAFSLVMACVGLGLYGGYPVDPEPLQPPEEVEYISADELAKKVQEALDAIQQGKPRSEWPDISRYRLKPIDENASASRSARWILIFRTEDGLDYVNQLALLKAQLFFPCKDDRDTKYLHFPDLKDLKNRKEIDEKQIPSDLMSFIDDKSESVERVAKALKMDCVPKCFIVLIPKDIEEELAAKERGYRNRREVEIHSTTFRILVKEGKLTISVTNQEFKKK